MKGGIFLSSVAKTMAKLWLTGFIFLLAIVGYFLYSLLWLFRVVQLHKKSAVFAFAMLLGLSAFVSYHLFPLRPIQRNQEIDIQSGTSLRAIADTLVNRDIVKSRRILLVWLKITGVDRRIQAGRFKFSQGEGVMSAARQLLKATPIEKMITIPEGLTIEQTARRLAEVLPIDTLEFIRLCKDTGYCKKLGLEYSTLEGYLFPNSYRFGLSVSASEVIERMVQQFAKAYEKLDTSFAGISRLSRHQIVTLASIVEKEATLASERSRIAGVFHNRLKIGMPLGADPTVRYILGKFDGPLTVSDLNTASPYNTRRYKGLPPGPICSPGIEAIKAALAPSQTHELFFVAKWDGTGAHDFSVTNAEHDRKKHAIRKQQMARKMKKEM